MPNIKYVLKEKDEIVLNEQIKDFCNRYNTPYDYSWIKTVETALNKDLENKWSVPSVTLCDEDENGNLVIDNSLVENNEYIQSAAGSGFGDTGELLVYKSLLKNGFTVKPKNPNGTMKFPDYIAVNGTYMDAKTVQCEEFKNKKGYKKGYSSGCGDVIDMRNICKKFVETNKLDNLSSALIIIIYYINDVRGQNILKIKIVPELFYINVYSDFHDFRTKRTEQNQSVTGSLVIRIDDENPFSCEPYLDRIRQTVNNLQ